MRLNCLKMIFRVPQKVSGNYLYKRMYFQITQENYSFEDPLQQINFSLETKIEPKSARCFVNLSK